MSRTLLITGATGFVGAALTLELLAANPNDRALCLVRAATPEAAQGRLRDALLAAAEAYEVDPTLAAEAMARAQALRGDVTAPMLGLDDVARARIAAVGGVHVFHAAASLKDTEEALAEILAHNVAGTEHVLDTLLPLNVAVFNHVSTAYVSGRHTTGIVETVERPRGFNNRYEQSKHYGEALVVDHCNRASVPWRILRPSIVIGHSRTGRATGYTGFLGWALKLAALDAAAHGALHRQPLRYVASGDSLLNLVPIDSVVEDIVGIDAAGVATHDRAFHLTNQAPPTVAWMLSATARPIGVNVDLVASKADLDHLSKRFHQWTRFERPYVRATRQFQRDHDVLYRSPRHGRAPLDEGLVARMVQHAVADWRRTHATQRGKVA